MTARVEAVAGDITTQHVDVVVNAAASSLLGGGGVDGALHAAAGPGLLAECRGLRRTRLPDGLAAGGAVVTGAHDLPARWVVHTVGPDARRGQTDPAVLVSCFTTCLELAGELGARSVAFPAVSAGAFGWDVTEVARVAVTAVRGALAAGAAPSVELVRFVLFSDAALRAFTAALAAPRTPSEPPPTSLIPSS